MRRGFAALLVIVAGLSLAAPAFADFPYTRGANTGDYTDYFLNNAQVPNDLGGEEYKFAATPDPANAINNARPTELGGVRGGHLVDDDPASETAFELSTGRPDVTIAVHDSGIEWDNAGAMHNLRYKTRLNQGEVPRPQGPCSSPPGGDPYDCNGDHVFNLEDYEDDPRVQAVVDGGAPRNGPSMMMTPQDVLIAFSNPGFAGDGKRGRVDDDGNGYVDDIVGWDFLDNDNDPFDDVGYGHGTGEAQDSTGEANNGSGRVGSCPNCMVIHMRVGDSFIADVNRFAAGVTYAADNDVQIVQSALGTLNGSTVAREAIDYAYRHGVTTILSAADEAAQHNNQPSLPHSILVNSMTESPVPAPDQSYTAFNGCTNYNAKITLAIPSNSCSSEAVGIASGMAGLIYSAALNAKAKGKLASHPDRDACETVDGQPCVITPNEVRQLMATGRIDGADAGTTLDVADQQSDDINFLSPGPTASPSDDTPEPACFPARAINCTGPYGSGNTYKALLNANRPALLSNPAVAESYAARSGRDQYYGWGRVNMRKAVEAVLPGGVGSATPSRIPPEAEITSPEWYEQLDPEQDFSVEGDVFARGGAYTCDVLVAPGQYPNQRKTTDAPPGDFKSVGTGWCDGTTNHSGAEAADMRSGTLATVDIATLTDPATGMFPLATDFHGPQPEASPATSNGRPAHAPHSFTVKLVVTTTTGPPMSGEDQRSAYVHRDAAMLDGFPRTVAHPGADGAPDYPTGDGESSPAFADLDGDNRNELIYATSDGAVHAIAPNGSELPGWPVSGDVPAFRAQHAGAPGYQSGAVNAGRGGAFLASVAVGDTDANGLPEVYAADLEGKIYGWNPEGQRIFTEESNPNYSGRPLQPFFRVRNGELNRTQHGFISSPVLADLEEDDEGDLELIAPNMDRHLYAWDTDDPSPGTPTPFGNPSNPVVDGYPVLIVDREKVDSIDPATHRIQFRSDAGAQQQGAIIDTPAVADIAGDSKPEIVLGANEGYTPPNPDDPQSTEPEANASATGNFGFTAADQAGTILETFDQGALINPGNTRLYALKASGDQDGDPATEDAEIDGTGDDWPVDLAFLTAGLLPVVGEGVTGYPTIGPATCPSGGEGLKIGVISYAGPAYVLNPEDGSSCYGNGPDGKHNTLVTDSGGSADAVDRPIIPAVGSPAFGDLGGVSPSLVIPAAGLQRAVDLALPENQPLGQDYIAAWDTSTGQFRPGFPQTQNDLSFLTGPSIADIDGLPGDEVISGSASLDLNAYNAAGIAVPGWPKLTTDWTIANPLIGSFGELETDDPNKVVIGMTRSGYINAYETGAPACSSSSWPRFHHDNANSGAYNRDAVLPGKPMEIAAASGALTFDAPGDDLLCGTATKYEIRTSNAPINEGNFKAATPLTGAPTPAAAGTEESYTLPAEALRYVAVRAVDDQDNVGRVASLDLNPSGGGPGGGGTGGGDTGGGTDTGGGGTGGGTAGGGAAGGGTPGRDCTAVISGTEGKDRLRGTDGSDRIRALAGKDRVKGAGGNDCINAGPNGDRARGNDGNDRIGGGSGPDRLRGDDGDDRITGGDDPDRIKGGDGDDRIRANGDGTRDRINCGEGDDVVFADDRDRVKNCERVR